MNDINELRKKVQKLEQKTQRIEQENRRLRALIQATNQDDDSSLPDRQLSRRRFLKLAGLGAGGLALSSTAAGWFSVNDNAGGGGGSQTLSDVLNEGNDISGNDIVDGGSTVWDSASGEIPNSAVEALANLSSDQSFTAYPLANEDISNSSVTVAGNTVSLGASTSIDHSDLSNTGSDDHHSKYTDSDARSAVDEADIDIQGDADTVDGSHASDFADTGHNHDSRYYQNDGNDKDITELRTDDPENPEPGRRWIRTDL